MQVRLGTNLAVQVSVECVFLVQRYQWSSNALQVTRSWLRMRTPIAAATDTNRLRGYRYFNLHEQSERGTPNTPHPHRNTLSSTPGKRTYGSKGGDCEGLTPDSSTGRDKKNLWNSQEAEADNKEEDQERHNRDGDKKTIPSLGSTKKRRPSAVEGTSASKRHVKRRRCLSPGRDEAVSSQGGCGVRIYTSESDWPVLTFHR